MFVQAHHNAPDAPLTKPTNSILAYTFKKENKNHSRPLFNRMAQCLPSKIARARTIEINNNRNVIKEIAPNKIEMIGSQTTETQRVDY